ncbi:alpha/beta fold hydrolase [Caldimonas brevitalea]|uniref:Uncharacterized protein n=1 Tax=Caldimonas brevitalea TaxID=413882 RepID=A0A0G3BHW9_9BURK|nr:alpha/beta fold hydrolase [Caldimonas brevitalea]AKJ29034.1 hypothetical protein AAW51_2343 [Caldimonas brevitalea]
MSKRLLITGASGFLGSHFLVRELLQGSGQIVCLGRDTLRADAEQRIRKALETAARDAGQAHEIGRLNEAFTARCTVLRADIEKPACGLTPEGLARIKVDEVWHFAAMLRFSLKLKEYVGKSICVGTANVLDVALAAGARVVNYLSSAIVAGNQVGLNTEVFHESLDTADTSYELAKRQAENLVRDRCREVGLAFRIFRPSIVVGHSQTHEGKTDTGFYGLITICAKLKNEIESKIPNFLSKHPIKLVNTSTHSAMNLIHVDDVIEQMATIAAHPESVGQIFHIVNKTQLPQDQMLTEMEEVLGIKVERVASIDEFEPLDHLVRKQMGEYEKYFSNYYEFDTTNADRYLEGRRATPISRSEARHLMEVYYARFQAEDRRATLFESPLAQFEKRELPAGENEVLTYYVGGRGERPVLIINAYGQSLHFWTELFNLMLDDYRVYLWEIRGTSVVEGGMRGNFTLNHHVSDACQILEAEGLRDCNLMGWCTGGKIALEVAARVPERVGKLICLTPSFKGVAGEDMDTDYEKKMEPLCRAVDRNPALTKLVQEFMGHFFAGVDITSETKDDKLNANVRGVMGMVNRNIRPLLVAPFVAEASILNYARQLLQFWAHDISPLYDKVDKPIMLLSGERDNIADPRLAHRVLGRFKQFVGFQVIGGSHYIHKDNSHSVKRMLDAFIEHSTEALPESDRLEIVY